MEIAQMANFSYSSTFISVVQLLLDERSRLLGPKESNERTVSVEAQVLKVQTANLNRQTALVVVAATKMTGARSFCVVSGR